ncbi:MAG: hypothetical protein HYZ28_18635 [Myxococcales bacterium]|nr:hypothetical protein [Myxococcales bacterium]
MPIIIVLLLSALACYHLGGMFAALYPVAAVLLWAPFELAKDIYRWSRRRP